MCNPRVLKGFLIAIFVILFILSASLLGAGGVTQDGIRKASIPQLSGYRPSQCTLDMVQIDKCPASGKFIAVWRRTEDNGSVVQSPFSYRPSADLAQRDTDNYPLDITLDCMCNPTYINPYPALICTLGQACFMDVEAVNYVQTEGFYYTYSADVLLSIGSLVLICTVVGSLCLALLIIKCQKDSVDNNYEKATE